MTEETKKNSSITVTTVSEKSEQPQIDLKLLKTEEGKRESE